MTINSFLHTLAQLVWRDRFPIDPFGEAPRAERATYLSLYEAARNQAHPYIDDVERRFGFAISKVWLDDLALHTQVVIKDAPLNYQHGRVLYAALSQLLGEEGATITGGVTVLETGTARGFSSICMAKALIDRDVEGRILTVDVLPANESIYWNCIDDLDGRKTRPELLAPWPDELKRVIFLQGWTKDQLQRIGLSRIHFAFLDAEHTKDDVLAEFSYVAARQRQGDVVVFDDVTPGQFDGVVAAIDWIEQQGVYGVTRLNGNPERGYAIARRRR